MQLAKEIFQMSSAIMKKSLDLQKYKLGKDSEEFIYYKQQIMEITYSNLKKIFRQMVIEKKIEKCPNKCSLTQGYKKCLCGGSGFINITKE